MGKKLITQERENASQGYDNTLCAHQSKNKQIPFDQNKLFERSKFLTIFFRNKFYRSKLTFQIK